MEDIAGNVLKLLNTWEKPEEPYIPDKAYVREKLKEYNIAYCESYPKAANDSGKNG